VTYSTLMACLRLGGANADILSVTGDLAERFKSSVLGVATRQPSQSMFTGAPAPEALIEQEEAAFRAQAVGLETEFREALKARALGLDWRAQITVGPLAEYIADQSRGADLVIARGEPGGVLSDPAHYLDLGDLLMRVGRPLLVCPQGVNHLKLDRVIVAWKDSPESRRATSDAMPFLEAAGEVILVSLEPEAQWAASRIRLDEVIAWLSGHGVAARAIVAEMVDDEARTLRRIARSEGAELVVAGAFGRGRLREWAFGGVTSDLLAQADPFTLLSH